MNQLSIDLNIASYDFIAYRAANVLLSFLVGESNIKS